MNEKIHILMVEDQKRHQKIYQDAITSQLDATITFAEDGDQALAMVQREPQPDIVILDLEMPRLSGEEVLSHIKKNPRLRYTPVIVLTGHGGPDKQLQLLEAGADDFLEKGATPEILLARLKAQIRHKLAMDRLERAALDRDLFAAGVLQDIGNIKWSIISHCRQAKTLLRQAAPTPVDEVVKVYEKLQEHAGKIGQYAHDIIQSVRDTQRAATPVAQDMKQIVEWLGDILATSSGSNDQALAFELAPDLAPVLADRNYLRLAALNIIQHALLAGRLDHRSGPRRFVITQEQAPAAGGLRPLLRTRFADPDSKITAREAADLFVPYGGHGSYSLGLSLVAKVMAKMGGRALAEPLQGGQGLAYVLELPSP